MGKLNKTTYNPDTGKAVNLRDLDDSKYYTRSTDKGFYAHSIRSRKESAEYSRGDGSDIMNPGEETLEAIPAANLSKTKSSRVRRSEDSAKSNSTQGNTVL